MLPTATYRIQMHAKFRFDDALAIAEYLHELGVSHVYSSPYLQAAKGSTHGYDVVDHNRVNEELGGEEAHQTFCEGLGKIGLGQVLDIVPNHMAVGTRGNVWWWDVLENGPSSRYASYFDVEWDPPESKLRNLVLVPILGDHYGRVLESRELRIEREAGKFLIRYFDHVLPAAPKSMILPLERAAHACGSEELAYLADTFSALPSPTATDSGSVRRRHRDKEVAANYLAQLCEEDPGVRDAIDAELAYLNSHPDALDAVFGLQNFRIAYWRTAGAELGYRRFFDINTLAGLRMEEEQVFNDTHRRILYWLRQGVLDGVRVDHPDGLRDPETYFARLRSAAPNAWIVAEKIIEPGEKLRSTWQVDGTTGYDFLFHASNVFVDQTGKEKLTKLYEGFTGRSSDYIATVRQRKQQVLRSTLSADISRLAALFVEVGERHRRFRDFTRHEIHSAIRELISCFPVYRTYVNPEEGRLDKSDVHYTDEAVAAAKANRPDLPEDLFEFIQSVLLLETAGSMETEFVARFQQFTGPAMAKGVEDTTFYVYNPLSSLNEVGGDPHQFGITPREYHVWCQDMQARWPATMQTLSTHDTKRSEDVRARIHLLSEIPDLWEDCVHRWSAHNEKHRTNDMPDRNMEYLLYQTMVGAWPIGPDRLTDYMEKASREAKTETSWTEPNEPYDKALSNFVTAVCADQEFTGQLAGFVRTLIAPGRVNSLAQALLKFTSPGIPDTYQGSELWDLSLVDPDNRRPVDYELRHSLLRELKSLTPSGILARSDDGLPKLYITTVAMHLRKSHPDWFGASAGYEPLVISGLGAEHAFGYLRGGQVAVLVPRLTLGSNANSSGTTVELPAGTWSHLLAKQDLEGGTVDVARLWEMFPVALLVKKGNVR